MSAASALAAPVAIHSGVESRVQDILTRLDAVLPERPAPLHAPSIGEAEMEAVADCVRSGWVSTAGRYVAEFEDELSQRCAAPYVVAVSTGTAALHISLLAMGVRPDDEVIVPSLTFAATAAAVAHAGAIPHFVDSERERLGLCPQALIARLNEIGRRKGEALINRETSRRIRAVVAVHLFGQPCRIEELKAICDAHGLPLLEDAAEALGAETDNAPVGGHGQFAALSFNGNKIVTAGGGGAVLAQDEAAAARLRHLATTAKLPHPYEYVHDEVGYNYRMPSLNAALALPQLRRLDGVLARKRRLFNAYRRAFAGCENAEVLPEAPGVRSNCWLTALQLADPELRDPLLEASNAVGVQMRPIWRPLHRLAPYSSSPRGATPIADDLGGRIINAPSGPDLADHLPEGDA